MSLEPLNLRSCNSCKYCKDNITRNFRFERVSCCINCEYKIRKYRFYEKNPTESKKFCKECKSLKELCEICNLIKKEIQESLNSKNSKTYDCQYCGDNQEQNFIKNRYTTCRNCHNEIRRERKKILPLMKNESEVSLPKTLESFSKRFRSEPLNIPEEINNLWKNFYDLNDELNLELQIKNEEILELKKEVSEFKKILKFLNPVNNRDPIFNLNPSKS
jgi:hypothetical protein